MTAHPEKKEGMRKDKGEREEVCVTGSGGGGRGEVVPGRPSISSACDWWIPCWPTQGSFLSFSALHPHRPASSLFEDRGRGEGEKGTQEEGAQVGLQMSQPASNDSSWGWWGVRGQPSQRKADILRKSGRSIVTKVPFLTKNVLRWPSKDDKVKSKWSDRQRVAGLCPAPHWSIWSLGDAHCLGVT